MAVRPVGKAPPLKQGLYFGVVIFIISFVNSWFKLGEINLAVFVASFVGAVVGGTLYGFINWLRYKG